METINLYTAIEDMRRMSAEGGTFAFSFYKYNRRNPEHNGERVTVKAARLRAKPKDEDVAHSDYKLFFTDTETGAALNCWEVLVYEFNGKMCVLEEEETETEQKQGDNNKVTVFIEQGYPDVGTR